MIIGYFDTFPFPDNSHKTQYPFPGIKQLTSVFRSTRELDHIGHGVFGKLENGPFLKVSSNKEDLNINDGNQHE